MARTWTSNDGRNGRWWHDYAVRGMTYAAIAARDGVHTSTVKRACDSVRDDIPQVIREEVRTEVLEFVRHCRAEALSIAELVPPPMVTAKDGTPVIDPDTGEVVRDYSGRLAALEAAARMVDRERKILGLDEASKVDVTVAGEEAAAAKLAAESAAYLDQDGE